MGKTHFSGPVKAGTIQNTTGSSLGSNVKNVGDVVLTQVAAITQADSATALSTAIVIPANSEIISIRLFSTTAWSGAATTISIGTSTTATELVSAGVTSGAVGVADLSPGTDATRTGKWINVGTTDQRIYVLSANTGTGVGRLVITYAQAIN